MRKRGRPVGTKLSEETKRKISTSKTGFVHSVKTKEKIAASVRKYYKLKDKGERPMHVEITADQAIEHLDDLTTNAKFWPRWEHTSQHTSKKTKSTWDFSNNNSLWNVLHLYEAIAEGIIERSIYQSLFTDNYRIEKLRVIRSQIKALGEFIFKVAAHDYVDILFYKHNSEREIESAKGIFERAIEVYAICLQLGFPDDHGFTELEPTFVEKQAAWLVGASLAIRDNIFDSLVKQAKLVVSMKKETEKPKEEVELEKGVGVTYIVTANYKNKIFTDELDMKQHVLEDLNRDKGFRAFPTVLKIERKKLDIKLTMDGLVLE